MKGAPWDPQGKGEHGTIEAQKELLSAALAALHAAAVLPYHLVAPHRRAVVTALNTSLDHPKRAVRRDAARCANAWHTLKKK